MRKYKDLSVCIVVIMIVDYLFPLYALHDKNWLITNLLIVLPVTYLVTSFVLGAKKGFNFVYIIVSVALFIPTLFIYYNATAWIYLVVYGVAALIGHVMGAWIRQLMKK